MDNRIQQIIKLQDKGMKLEDIAKELNLKESTLKRSLNKNGYKSVKGIYVKKEEAQITFIEQEAVKPGKKTKKAENKKEKREIKVERTLKTTNSKTKKPKKDRKINMTQEDMDKLCEVYDWYLQVKDNNTIKSKKSSNKKDIKLEDIKLSEMKSTNIKVEKSVWEDFERLCSNSQFTKQEIITQAIKDFMKNYKHLI